jgi:hypothetical protein
MDGELLLIAAANQLYACDCPDVLNSQQAGSD